MSATASAALATTLSTQRPPSLPGRLRGLVATLAARDDGHVWPPATQPGAAASSAAAHRRPAAPLRWRRAPLAADRSEGPAARRDRQGRHRQDHGRRRARAGPGQPRPDGAAVRGRGPPGHRAALRRRPAAVRRAPDRHRPARAPRPRGQRHALHVDPESALLEYLSMYYHLGRAGRALDRFGVVEFATTLAPGVRDVLLTGKVYEAAKAHRRAKGVPQLRRGRARRPAHGPDRAVPRRQQRARRAGEGRADPAPGRPRDEAAPVAADRRSTWSRCWRRCRSRRPPTGSPSCARPGCRSAPWSSTWCARRTSAPTSSRPPAPAPCDAARVGDDLARRAGLDAGRRPGRRAARRGARPRRTPGAGGRAAHGRRRPRRPGRTSCPAHRRRRPRRRSTSWPRTCKQGGLA